MTIRKNVLMMAGVVAASAPLALGVACSSEEECDPATDPTCEAGEGGAGGSGGSGSGIVDLGTVDLATEDTDNGVFYAETTVTIPDGTVGANLIAVLPGNAENLVLIDKVSRGGATIRDFWADPTGPLRGDPVENTFTLQYPTSDAVSFGTGEHTIRVAADAAQTGVRLYGVFKGGGAPTAGTLDFNVYFAGIDGLNAGNAGEHAKFQELWTEATRLFAKAGISVGDVRFIDADAQFADVQGPSSSPGTDLGRLFASTEPNPGKRVNLFFVRRLSQETGDPLLGISGGVPGPGELVGNTHAGIVANAEAMLDPNAPAGDKNQGALLVAQIAVHETFHYLGLNHTSERGWGDGTCPGGENSFDPIPDTAECGTAQDGSTGNPPNCSVGTGECVTAGGDNIMFWAGVDYSKLPAEADAQVSNGQKYVLLRNPLTK